MTVKRMDNVGIVVEDLDATIGFFTELGLTLEGRAMIEGEWAGRVTGLGAQHVEIAMMRTPDGHSRLELCRYLSPAAIADHRNAPVNALGYLRVMFAVEDLDARIEDLKVDVFGPVAIATGVFQGQARVGDEVASFATRTTLVFVDDAGDWLIAHEHHSPFVASS